MKFLVPKLQLSPEPLTRGLPPPRSSFSLSSTEFVEPPPNRIPGYATDLEELRYKSLHLSEIDSWSSRPLWVNLLNELYSTVHAQWRKYQYRLPVNPNMARANIRPTNQHFKVQLPSCKIFSEPRINDHTGPIIQSFLGEFAKLWKATISFAMSVCPSALNSAATTKRFITKFDIWGFFENLSRKPSFIKIWPE